MFEVWKPVVGYDGLYEVSNFGNVKACAKPKLHRGHVQHTPERLLKPAIIRGYCSVKLVKCGVYKNHYVHRLVAEAFIDNPNNLSEINHIDEIKSNNRVDNLEWCDRNYNVNYGTGQLRRVASVKLKRMELATSE
jgi:hypothetical protein